MCSVKMRQKVEREIALAAVTQLIDAGFGLNINNGGDEPELEAPSRDIDIIMETMFATDEDRLLVFPVGPRPYACVGWIFFVYGNDGYDVISDYTTNLEEHLTEANKVSASYAD